MKLTSSRDLSIIMNVEVRFVKENRTRRGISWLVVVVGVKRKTRRVKLDLWILFYLIWMSSELESTSPIVHNNTFCIVCIMSRAGRGGGRGGFGGRNTFGANNPPPMGLTFADIQAISREQSALYPVCLSSASYTFVLTVLRIIVHSLSSPFRH
jgi:hypothetical protein